MACIPVSVSSSRQITMRWAVGLRPCPAPVVSAIARQHYDEAADLLESGKGYYKEEDAMRKNITNGLDVFQGFAPQENR